MRPTRSQSIPQGDRATCLVPLSLTCEGVAVVAAVSERPVRGKSSERDGAGDVAVAVTPCRVATHSGRAPRGGWAEGVVVAVGSSRMAARTEKNSKKDRAEAVPVLVGLSRVAPPFSSSAQRRGGWDDDRVADSGPDGPDSPSAPLGDLMMGAPSESIKVCSMTGERPGEHLPGRSFPSREGRTYVPAGNTVNGNERRNLLAANS